MSDLFNDLKTALEQAIAIEKGEIPLVEVKGMPGKTYRVKDVAAIDEKQGQERGIEDE